MNPLFTPKGAGSAPTPAAQTAPKLSVAIIGGGWAGCAALVALNHAGHQVTLFEATSTLGGRARRVEAPGQALSISPNTPLQMDNGQHILLGAYTETLKLLTKLGVGPRSNHKPWLRMPMQLRQPNGDGLSGGRSQSAAWNMASAILGARGWSFMDKARLLVVATGWQLRGFTCAANTTVAQLCAGLSPRVVSTLIEPLCESALNTPAERASASVFLRLLKDALFTSAGSSDFLLPMTDLSALMPEAAAAFAAVRGAQMRMGTRVTAISRSASTPRGVLGTAWQVQTDEVGSNAQVFDHVVLACPPWEAARLCQSHNPEWARTTQALQYEAIATVYALAFDTSALDWPCPMLALPNDPHAPHTTPAQFVFDRGALGGPSGLLAFVVSAAQGSAAELEAAVIAQGQRELKLPKLKAVQTIVEKRATFACTPGLVRPLPQIAPHLQAVGDYISGPYPATLEGAVRSGLGIVV